MRTLVIQLYSLLFALILLNYIICRSFHIGARTCSSRPAQSKAETSIGLFEHIDLYLLCVTTHVWQEAAAAAALAQVIQ